MQDAQVTERESAVPSRQTQLGLPSSAGAELPRAEEGTELSSDATKTTAYPQPDTRQADGSELREPARAKSPSGDPSRDPAVAAVVAWFADRHGLTEVFGKAIRQAIDDVLDGPRTGRWSRDQLEKTEKIYVGTRIEILARTALGLERVGRLDTIVAGVQVDFKWSFQSVWEIPTEAVGEVCLLIGGRGDEEFAVGILRTDSVVLNPGRNKDGKRTISAAGKKRARWLVERARLPTNFLATLPADVRDYVMQGDSGQERVRRLFNKVVETPIPRLAVATVAQQLDPTRRVRADAARDLGPIRIFSGRYGNAGLVELGYAPIGRDEFMSVPIDKVRTRLEN